jgi:hypothetical protein
MKESGNFAWIFAIALFASATSSPDYCFASELGEKVANADRVVAYNWVAGSVYFLAGREAREVVQVVSKAEKPPTLGEPHICVMWFELQFYEQTNLLANVGFQGNGFVDHQLGALFIVQGDVLKRIQRRLEKDKSARKAWVDHLAQDFLRVNGATNLQQWSVEIMHLPKGDGLGTYGFRDREAGTNFVANVKIPRWEEISKSFPYKPAPDVLVHFTPSGKPECVFVTWGIDVGFGLAIGPADYKSSMRAWYRTNSAPGVNAFWRRE